MNRLAVDIGGTFTDLLCYDDSLQELRTAKCLSTPDDVVRAVEQAIAVTSIKPESVTFFVHGGTIVINTIIERSGAKTGFVTTKGFRDVLEIGRGNRPDLYNLRYRKPPPFVPRHLRLEVGERLDASGSVVEPVSFSDMELVVEALRAAEIEAVAIQFLHSYVEPEHERICAAFLRERLPGVPVTASHELTREWREFERASTTVLNAYVRPATETYLARLETSLKSRGVTCPILSMQSNGGVASLDWARRFPITLMESGPAAAVNYCAAIGELRDEPNLIFFDVGGTTAKCAILEKGLPHITTDYRLEALAGGSGYPVKIPMIDIVEIGTGGGSIAFVDQAGRLQVGPRSAGAAPGPACYGLGGDQPTITDAKLLTGHLDPDYFAGGSIKLSVDKARKAIETLARTLDIDVAETASGIARLADAAMMNALRLVTLRRGYDPREFALVACGGGGPMHAAALGGELRVRKIIIPPYPGYASAWGMLMTEPRRDFVRTLLRRSDEIDIADLKAIFAALESEAQRYMKEDVPASEGAAILSHAVEARYLGQEHSVSVPFEYHRISLREIREGFHEAHERAYAFRADETPVEFVSYRLTVRDPVSRPRLKPIDRRNRSAAAALKGERRLHFGALGNLTVRVFDRDRLPPDFSIAGPVIVEEPSSTTIVLPSQRLTVDTYGIMEITDFEDKSTQAKRLRRPPEARR
jgi:N-methylhydantoinase A